MIERGDFGAEFFEKYPRCFPEREYRPGKTTRSPIYGADCGVGWWPILHRLFADLEVLAADFDSYFAVQQVKEKRGGLCVYVSCENEEITDRIQEAEDESFRTCEYCGKPGEPRRGGWVKTLCDECAEVRSGS